MTTAPDLTGAATRHRAAAPVSHDLDIPYADVRADQLSWALDLPDRAALATRTLTLPGHTTLTVTMHILGASHQLRIASAAGEFSETVACDLPHAAADLPESLTRTHPVGTYQFSSTVHTLNAYDLTMAVDGVRDRCLDRRRNEHALIAQFPGNRDAITALLLTATPQYRIPPAPHTPPVASLYGVAAGPLLIPAPQSDSQPGSQQEAQQSGSQLDLAPDRWALDWSTWHAYPEAGELVETRSSLTVSARTAPVPHAQQPATAGPAQEGTLA